MDEDSTQYYQDQNDPFVVLRTRSAERDPWNELWAAVIQQAMDDAGETDPGRSGENLEWRELSLAWCTSPQEGKHTAKWFFSLVLRGDQVDTASKRIAEIARERYDESRYVLERDHGKDVIELELRRLKCPRKRRWRSAFAETKSTPLLRESLFDILEETK